ncbi:MAG: TOBE domain-containing protein [Acidimicrobiales bacterium]
MIELVECHGHDTMYVVAAAGLELRVRVAGTAPLARGSTVGLRVVADRVRAFPRAGD